MINFLQVWAFELTRCSLEGCDCKMCLLSMSFNSESRNWKFIKLTFELWLKTMFGSKRKGQKWFEITFYQKDISLKHFILYNSALKGPNLLSNTYFGNLLFTLDSTQCVESKDVNRSISFNSEHLSWLGAHMKAVTVRCAFWACPSDLSQGIENS